MEQLSNEPMLHPLYIGVVILGATVNSGQTNPNPKPNPVTGTNKPTGK